MSETDARSRARERWGEVAEIRFNPEAPGRRARDAAREVCRQFVDDPSESGAIAYRAASRLVVSYRCLVGYRRVESDGSEVFEAQGWGDDWTEAFRVARFRDHRYS